MMMHRSCAFGPVPCYPLWHNRLSNNSDKEHRINMSRPWLCNFVPDIIDLDGRTDGWSALCVGCSAPNSVFCTELGVPGRTRRLTLVDKCTVNRRGQYYVPVKWQRLKLLYKLITCPRWSVAIIRRVHCWNAKPVCPYVITLSDPSRRLVISLVLLTWYTWKTA